MAVLETVRNRFLSGQSIELLRMCYMSRRTACIAIALIVVAGLAVFIGSRPVYSQFGGRGGTRELLDEFDADGNG